MCGHMGSDATARVDPMWLPSVIPNGITIFRLFVVVIAFSVTARCFAAEQAVPGRLKEHVGEEDGQIAQVVLQKRAHFT